VTRAPAGTISDHDLILRVADGDGRAFEAIYDRYSSRAFGLAMRITNRHRGAEEATQEAFLSLWRTARNFDAERGTLNTWLLAMVHNRSIDWLRREARHHGNLVIDDARVAQLEAVERTEEQVADREATLRARQLLTSLPREQRQVIELAYFGGLTQDQIAAKLEIPLGTVKGRQRLALTKLHRRLSGSPELALTG
jgi:RNA polymerase sigma-70 factor (ECF subfamily)